MAKGRKDNKFPPPSPLKEGDYNPQEVYAGKVPPHSKELEMNILGGLMVDNALIDIIVPIVKPNMMYFSANGMVFQVIIDLHDKHQPVDTLTITEELKARGELEAAGGPFYIAELSNAFSSHDTVEYSAQKILEHWVKRDLILLTYAINEQCYDPTMEAKALLDNTQRQVLAVSDALYKKKHVTATDLFFSTVERAELIAQGNKEILGVPSGFKELDGLTGGFQKSELIIIAGRPSHGKSSLALNFAMNAAKAGIPGGIFSIEDSNLLIGIKMAAVNCEVNISNLKSGKLTQDEWERLASRGPRVKDYALLMVDDSSPLTLMEMKSKTRRWKAEYGIGWVIVDYLQIMDLDAQDMRLDRHLQVGIITKGLKQLSKELDMPVIALSQLSRKVEDRAGKDKRPQLSDLRESGNIEQDADVVIFVSRPELYLNPKDKDYMVEWAKVKGKAELIIAKQRSGPIGDVPLAFLAKYGKFGNLDRDDDYGQMRVDEPPAKKQQQYEQEGIGF